jgi:hypothetical protein
MFTGPENVEACSKLASGIMHLIDAAEAPKPVAANAVLNVLAMIVVENAAERGADPMDDADKWAKGLRTVVEMNLKFPNGLS